MTPERIAGLVIFWLVVADAFMFLVLSALKWYSKLQDRQLAEQRRRLMGRWWMN